ncbi:MAG TPA: type 4a pilus biogenesis protein PilO [Blastocatellia bacterium]|nr:type 4a pilus biogenesis protein PilO [Blastocatellia bacterium]
MVATMSSIAKTTDDSGSFFTRMPWYYQMGLLLALVGLLIFAAHALFYSETRAQTAKIHEQIQSLKAKNAQGSIIRQNLAATEATLDEKRDEIERLRDLLPDQVEISRVFDNVKDYMRAQKLELKRFSPLKAAPSEFYTAQPIQVEVTGTYDNLGQFFSQLGFFKRIVSVTDVEIKQAEDGGQEAGRSINSAFVVTAFYIAPDNLEKLTMKKPAAPAKASTQAVSSAN